LEDISSVDLVAALLKLNYQDGLTPDSFKHIDEVSIDTTGTSRLFIALGRQQGYSPRSLVEMIQKEAGVNPRDIDDVRVMEEFSFVTVPFAEAEVILHVFSKQKSNGRSLVSKAKDKKSDGGGRREYRPKSYGEKTHYGERKSYEKRENTNYRGYNSRDGEKRKNYGKRESGEKNYRRR
jgi:ATP-dependent RNA helicase DeaD